ncbi:MAG TPA: DHA2 family efflux MFS transporter permease subunit [Gemmatimonadales bacterium]|nr:DHA2 family efflux MFS transporter permease subunit [Gemmatimonadales bacterium]
MAEPRPAPGKWTITVTVLTGTMIAVLDSSIVNVALPNMAGTLGATIEEITWVITAYILANVIIMPIIGMLSAHLGRKNIYLASVVTFTVASMACGAAGSMPLIIFFRVLQGLGGGVLITVSQAILRETFPAEEQGLAMGIYGMGVVLAPAFGPTLGGWLTDTYSWPWIFYINVPIGIINIILVQRYIFDPPYLRHDKGPIDFLGVGLLTVGLGAFQLMLEKGEEKDWFDSSFIVWLALVAAVGMAVFLWREFETDHPAVDLRLFKNGGFAAATSLGGILGMGLYGSLFILPLFLQNNLGYPAMKSGLALMPRSLAMAVVMPLAGRFYNKLGPKVLIAGGLLVSAYSFWALGQLTPDIGFWDIFIPQMWQGVGFSLLFVALSTAALATIERRQMTAAAGLYNVVRQVFGSIGIAIAATQITGGISRTYAVLSAHVTAYDPATRSWLAAVTGAMLHRFGGGVAMAREQALALLHGSLLSQAAVIAYNRVFLLIAISFVLSLPLVILITAGEATDGVEVMID